MIRGTVARYGDDDITTAIADGMAAAKLERELNELKIMEARYGVKRPRERRDYEAKIKDAEHYYGDSRPLPRIPNLLLGFYGLIVWTIHSLSERLKAANRAP